MLLLGQWADASALRVEHDEMPSRGGRRCLHYRGGGPRTPVALRDGCGQSCNIFGHQPRTSYSGLTWRSVWRTECTTSGCNGYVWHQDIPNLIVFYILYRYIARFADLVNGAAAQVSFGTRLQSALCGVAGFCAGLAASVWWHKRRQLRVRRSTRRSVRALRAQEFRRRDDGWHVRGMVDRLGFHVQPSHGMVSGGLPWRRRVRGSDGLCNGVYLEFIRHPVEGLNGRAVQGVPHATPVLS